MLRVIFSVSVQGRGAAHITGTTIKIPQDVSPRYIIERGRREEACIVVDWIIISVVVILTRANLLVLPCDEIGKKCFARIHRVKL